MASASWLRNVLGRRRRSRSAASLLALHEAGDLVDRATVAAFPWRDDARDLGPGDLGEVRGTEAAVGRAQSLEHGVRRDGYLLDPHAERIEDRVGERRHDRQQRPLAHFLRAEGTGAVRLL